MCDYRRPRVAGLTGLRTLELSTSDSAGVLMHEILAACAVLRRDLGDIKDHGRTWLCSLPRTTDPQRTVRRFSRAFALAADTRQGAEHLRQLVALVEKWALARDDLLRKAPPRPLPVLPPVVLSVDKRTEDHE